MYNKQLNEYENKYREIVYFSDKFPVFLCSTCKIGHILKPKNITEEETGPSKRLHNEEHWDYDRIINRWTALTTCNRQECGEIYIFSGDSYVEEDCIIGDNDGDYSSNDYYSVFKIKATYPSIMLFHVPHVYPDAATEELLQSFSLLFSNPSASANALRRSLEIFLTEVNIQKIKVVNGRRKQLSLHDRIKLYVSKNPNLHTGTYLEAIKWIGNAGSHESNLKAENVLHAYDFMEIVLDDLALQAKKKKSQKSVKAINKRKKPVF